jgi:molybdenum cofactor synthesis domain-containing protein
LGRRGALDLILTTGGTGLAPSDVTPEATAAVVDRPAPGIAEAIRQASQPHTDLWMLSRGIAGARGSTLIVNLPGNPASIDETAPVLETALPTLSPCCGASAAVTESTRPRAKA